MRFVAKCNDCGKQKILNEWGECKRCFNIFKKTLQVPTCLTDKGSRYTFPIKQTQAIIITDDRYEPQPDPAKIDEVVVRMKALELGQWNRALGKILHKNLETKNLRYTDGKCEDLVTKHDADPKHTLNLEMRKLFESRALDEGLRKIFRKGLETKDLHYTTPKCKEKI